MYMQTKLDSKVLVASGAALLALSLFFLWRQVNVAPELLVGGGAIAAALGAVALRGRVWQLVAPGLLVLSTAVGAGWYALSRPKVMLLSLAATLVASVVNVLRTPECPEDAEGRVRSVTAWFSVALSFLATTGALYFEYFTLGFAEEHVGRRAVLTGMWLVAGTALVLLARKRGTPATRDAGFVVLAAALGKLLFYDTVHLEGALRIALLAGSGTLLFGTGSFLLPRLSSPSRLSGPLGEMPASRTKPTGPAGALGAAQRGEL